MSERRHNPQNPCERRACNLRRAGAIATWVEQRHQGEATCAAPAEQVGPFLRLRRNLLSRTTP